MESTASDFSSSGICSSILHTSSYSSRKETLNQKKALDILKLRQSPCRDCRNITKKDTIVSVTVNFHSKKNSSRYNSLISSNSVKNVLINVGVERNTYRRLVYNFIY